MSRDDRSHYPLLRPPGKSVLVYGQPTRLLRALGTAAGHPRYGLDRPSKSLPSTDSNAWLDHLAGPLDCGAWPPDQRSRHVGASSGLRGGQVRQQLCGNRRQNHKTRQEVAGRGDCAHLARQLRFVTLDGCFRRGIQLTSRVDVARLACQKPTSSRALHLCVLARTRHRFGSTWVARQKVKSRLGSTWVACQKVKSKLGSTWVAGQ